MTLPANIRVNIGAPFPALVKASGPVTISKQNGIWTVGFQIANLGVVANGANPATLQLIVWNTAINSFQQMTVAAATAGGGAITPTAVAFANSPYVPLATDQLLLVDTSGGAVVINMPACATRNGLALTVKDATGNANANPITVNRNGAETIDTATFATLDSKFAAVKFQPKTAGGYAIV